MKILQIHKYFSKKRGGGSVAAFFETKTLLEQKGHDVLIFSMKDENNEKSNENEFFANHFDIKKTRNFLRKTVLIPRVLYNYDASKKLDLLLKEKKPDIAHVHNIYHYLTPSIFKALKKYNIPIVFKLSDYHAISPNYKLFANGKIDESCKGNKYYKLFLNKSINNSYAESFVGMIEGYLNKLFKFYEQIDAFIAPSNFMEKICVEYNINKDKIYLLRNVLNFKNYPEKSGPKERYFLYMGRLSEEKGLPIAIDAVEKLKRENRFENWKLIITGKGPCKKFLKKKVSDLGLTDIIKFKPHCKKGSQQWISAMNGASVAILPSIWYDNSPMSISESMAFSTPVIVSDSGGTKEMIQEGKSGFVFKTNNSEDLAQKMKIFIDDNSLIKRMGECANESVRELNNEEKYYTKLMNIYEKALSNKKGGRLDPFLKSCIISEE